MSVLQVLPNETFIDITDRVSREILANRLGVSDERLRKAFRIVGPRIASITAYLSK